jgi:uncharacterized protein (DUF302 family)
MKRFIPVVALFAMMAGPSQAASPQEQQAQNKQMQEAQAKMMAAMMTEMKSRLGFKETVAALQESARKRGWQIGQVIDMQEVMIKAGQKNAKPFTVLPMCKQDLVESLLKAQAEQKTMPYAPCRMSVFEGTDGKVYVAKPNTEFMTQMATPAFAPLLKKFAEEEKALLANIAE